MCATGVALACGVIGVLAILVAVLTGHKFDVAAIQVHGRWTPEPE